MNIFQLITSIGSLATFGLFLFAIYQYRAHYKKEQAKNISSWIISNEGQTAWLAISNQSKSPVYEVILTLVAFQGAGDPTGKTLGDEFRVFLSVLPPGKYYAKTMGHHGMMFHPAVKIVFTDNLGTNWAREGDGSLHKIYRKPMEYYNLSRPITWDYPLDKLPND